MFESVLVERWPTIGVSGRVPYHFTWNDPTGRAHTFTRIFWPKDLDEMPEGTVPMLQAIYDPLAGLIFGHVYLIKHEGGIVARLQVQRTHADVDEPFKLHLAASGPNVFPIAIGEGCGPHGGFSPGGVFGDPLRLPETAR